MAATIVFDLDGTLIDSAPDIHAGANSVLAEEGYPPLSLDEARSFIGNGAAVFVERMRAARGIDAGAQDRLLSAFLDRYETFVGLTRPYPGVPGALRALRDRDHRLGLCTNKPARPTAAVLDHLGLAEFFGTVIAGDSLPVRKPDPAPLRAAARAAGGDPAHCLLVGDTATDRETSRAAGVPSVLVTFGPNGAGVHDLAPEATIDHYEELPGVVARLLGRAVAFSEQKTI